MLIMAEIKETKNFNYPRDSACHAKVSIESVACHCDCGVALPRALFSHHGIPASGNHISRNHLTRILVSVYHNSEKHVSENHAS